MVVMRRMLRGFVLWAAIAGSIQAATFVLYDFSASNEANYNFIPVGNNPADGWAVISGQLRPNIAVNATGAWIWNRGQKLGAVGDSVSVTLYPDWNHTEQT